MVASMGSFLMVDNRWRRELLAGPPVALYDR